MKTVIMFLATVDPHMSFQTILSSECLTTQLTGEGLVGATFHGGLQALTGQPGNLVTLIICDPLKVGLSEVTSCDSIGLQPASILCFRHGFSYIRGHTYIAQPTQASQLASQPTGVGLGLTLTQDISPCNSCSLALGQTVVQAVGQTVVQAI